MKFLLAVMLLLVPSTGMAQPLWTGDRGPVQIDQALLDDLLNKAARQFSLPVDGREFRVDVQSVSQPNLGVISLFGRIDDNPASFFLLCRTENGATIAFFQPGDGSAYRLDHTKGRDEIRAIDYESMGSCGGALTGEQVPHDSEPDHPHPARPAPHVDKSRAVADDGSRHDILVGYTPAAETVMGGWDYIRAEAQLAVDAANLTYGNSSISSQLRLVHVMDTDYEEITAWEYNDHVEYLANPADGQMDDMIVMRDRVGADFVSVLIDGRNFMGEVLTCGVAYIMESDQVNQGFAYLAASVVSVSCATENWTLAHEVGHNRGCAHNRENAINDGAYTYAYGRRYVGDGDAWYRTVMAYDHFEGGYTRIPYFTNPYVNYGGEPTGVPIGQTDEAHNAHAHNNTSPVCAAFRSEHTFVQFGSSGSNPNGLILSPFPSIIEAIWGSRDGGTIAIFDDRPSFTGILADPRSYVHEGGGSTVLGGS